MRFHYIHDAENNLRVTIATDSTDDGKVGYGVTIQSIEDINHFDTMREMFGDQFSKKDLRKQGKKWSTGRCRRAISLSNKRLKLSKYDPEWREYVGQRPGASDKNPTYNLTRERFKKFGVMEVEEFKQNLANLRQAIGHINGA